MKLNVLYPSEDCIAHFDSFYKKKLNKLTQKIDDIHSKIDSNVPKPLKIDLAKNFNDHSVVLEAIGDKFNSIYLADLEIQDPMGLGYVLSKASKANTKYNIFKVPHHGSKTSFDSNLWKDVLAVPFNDQILNLTCWKKGSNFLPQEDIIKKMLLISDNIFCTGIPKEETVKIKNKTKKYYSNINLKFTVYAQKYGNITIQQDKATQKLKLNIVAPAVHVSELLA